MHRLVSLALILLVGLPGCAKRTAPDGCPAIRSLFGRNPVKDAEEAFQRGDKRVLELGGLVGTTPGAEGSGASSRMMGGTSDTETQACSALRSKAEAYATAYNRKMVYLRGSSNDR